MKDAGDKVDAAVKAEVENKVKELRSILQTAPLEELKKKTEELSLSLQKIGQAMYGASGSAQNGPQSGPQDSPSDNPGGSEGGPTPPPGGDIKEGEIVEE